MRRLTLFAAVTAAALWLMVSVALAGPYQQEFRVWTASGSISCDGDNCSWVLEFENPFTLGAGDTVAYTVLKSTDPGMDQTGFLAPSNGGNGWDNTSITVDQTNRRATLTLQEYMNYYVWVKAEHKNSGNTVLATKTHFVRIYPPDKIPHGNYATETNLCLNCHQTHSGQAPRMLRAASAAALCATCHNGMGSKYDVIDSQIRGKGEAVGSDNSSEFDSSAGAFGSVQVSGQEGNSLSRVTSNHTLGLNISNAPGSGGSYVGELSCVNCHNPHGTSNYRIIKTVNNQFAVDVPAKAVTVNQASGKERSHWFGSYNDARTATSTLTTNTALGSNGTASVTLASTSGITLANYVGSFMKIDSGSTTYWGQMTAANQTTGVVTLRAVKKGLDSWPGAGALASAVWSIPEADPKASVTTLCQSCHTSFAMARSGARESGVSDDGGAGRRYRHAIGIEVYAGRAPDTPEGWTPSDYEAIPTGAAHPYSYGGRGDTAFPYTVLPENIDETAWSSRKGVLDADPGSTTHSGKNRVVCISCHFAHGTDRVGFNPVTNATVSQTESVETNTATASGSSSITVVGTAMPGAVRGLSITYYSQVAADTTVSATSSTITLASAAGVSVGMEVKVSGQYRTITALAGAVATVSPDWTSIPSGSYSVHKRAEARTITDWNSTSKVVSLNANWSASGTPVYKVERLIDSMNPNDSGSGKAASTVLKRVDNMGVCQACHQK